MKIGEIITATELNKCEPIKSFGDYRIYRVGDEDLYIFAINNTKLICSCFEFYNGEDRKQLKRMNTIPNLKEQGIGTEILKQAVVKLEVFELPSIDTSQMYYFTEDGLGWIRRRFDDCTLKQPPFIRP